MHLSVDTDTYAVLPWTPEDMRRARFFCDIMTPNDEPFAGDPRGVLKKMMADLEERRIGLQLRTGTGIFPVQAQRRHAPCPA